MLSQKEKLYAKLCAERTRRSSNFSTREVKFLLQLVERRKDVIESKKSDRATWENKLKAWLEIEEEFNVDSEDYRSYKVLKTKYENLKNSLKRNRTGNVSNTDLLKKMQSTIPTVEETQFSDCNHNANTDEEDAYCKSNASDRKIKPHPPLNENELNDAEEYMFENLLFGDTQTSESRKETNSLKQNECQVEQESNKAKSIDIWEQVAHKKLRKLDLEMNVIEEEWNLRKRKIELEIENIKTDYNFKEEKVKLEIENIKIENQFKEEKTKLEIENIKIENQFKEEKYKLELELLRHKLQNNNST